jgi:hypothetical protein
MWPSLANSESIEKSWIVTAFWVAWLFPTTLRWVYRPTGSEQLAIPLKASFGGPYSLEAQTVPPYCCWSRFLAETARSGFLTVVQS